MYKARHLILCAFAFLAAGFILGGIVLPKKSAALSVPGGASNPISNEPARKPVASQIPDAKPVEQITRAQMETELQRLSASLSSEARFDDLIHKLIDWAATDPKAALDYARSQFTNERQSQALGRVLVSLAKNNPQAAWDWTFKNVPQNFQHLDIVLNEVGKADATDAWKFATEYAAKYTNEAYNAYIGAFRGMAYGGNYETATRLMKEANLITPPSGDYDLPALVAAQWAHYEPDKAAKWVVSLPQGDARAEALLQIGNSWAQMDPHAAADFAVNLPTGETRERVMTQVVQNWAEKDPAAAATWINQFDADPDFDQVLMTIATSPQADTKTAISWANNITQKELRIQSLTRVVWAWLGKDQAAAVNYLQTCSELSPEVRAEIQQRIQTQSAQ